MPMARVVMPDMAEISFSRLGLGGGELRKIMRRPRNERKIEWPRTSHGRFTPGMDVIGSGLVVLSR